jgi:hypothetical protein
MRATTLTLLTLAGISAALPSPVEQAPPCGATIGPAKVQLLDESHPETHYGNSINTRGYYGEFKVSQHVDENDNLSNRNFSVVIFKDIPAGAYGCHLNVQFPDDFKIDYSSDHSPALDVKTLTRDDLAGTNYEASVWGWNSVYHHHSGRPSGEDTTMFGTTTLKAGTPATVINSEACPVGGGNLEFVFSIAAGTLTDERVSFNYSQNIDLATYTPKPVKNWGGFFLTYNC